MRYINLSLILTLRLVCLPVKKRFPHYDHLVEAGILEKGEKKVQKEAISIIIGVYRSYITVTSFSLMFYLSILVLWIDNGNNG